MRSSRHAHRGMILHGKVAAPHSQMSTTGQPLQSEAVARTMPAMHVLQLKKSLECSSAQTSVLDHVQAAQAVQECNFVINGVGGDQNSLHGNKLWIPGGSHIEGGRNHDPTFFVLMTAERWCPSRLSGQSTSLNDEGRRASRHELSRGYLLLLMRLTVVTFGWTPYWTTYLFSPRVRYHFWGNNFHLTDACESDEARDNVSLAYSGRVHSVYAILPVANRVLLSRFNPQSVLSIRVHYKLIPVRVRSSPKFDSKSTNEQLSGIDVNGRERRLSVFLTGLPTMPAVANFKTGNRCGIPSHGGRRWKSHRYTQHDENTARQFRALRIGAMGNLIPVAVSRLTLPRLSASNAAKDLDYPPSTYANRVRLLAGPSPGFSHVGIVPDDAAGRRVFSGISRFTPALAFRCCSALTAIHRVGSRDLDVKSWMDSPSKVKKRGGDTGDTNTHF
ncbi:hypothetical protein PR048_033481 [Dryococelus australis]|uniref:Uncharacterized protein n=1 Tax=Dryococelus australis TaxID=614101 RepID=A0ABQ9G0E8_9NEOP|nr:hypothetical protein PR048_033481 [Dryococelus australis]